MKGVRVPPLALCAGVVFCAFYTLLDYLDGDIPSALVASAAADSSAQPFGSVLFEEGDDVVEASPIAGEEASGTDGRQGPSDERLNRSRSGRRSTRRNKRALSKALLIPALLLSVAGALFGYHTSAGKPEGKAVEELADRIPETPVSESSESEEVADPTPESPLPESPESGEVADPSPETPVPEGLEPEEGPATGVPPAPAVRQAPAAPPLLSTLLPAAEAAAAVEQYKKNIMLVSSALVGLAFLFISSRYCSSSPGIVPSRDLEKLTSAVDKEPTEVLPPGDQESADVLPSVDQEAVEHPPSVVDEVAVGVLPPTARPAELEMSEAPVSQRTKIALDMVGPDAARVVPERMVNRPGGSHREGE
ncbi:hypothetical protein BESB_014650 [Besnoitia besnoiti]|uniref:Transmembrane protein n=1 Tax=Besnoitia besnoiti TaxID=94643 RepID=A0A2A9MBT3_BESBE|nr:hypothetical protein BESB_014650 [Besnoitia besnoiti]PFH32852.1 hypothetical protein BESB_014650 [Besnoitia besnoiti]